MGAWISYGLGSMNQDLPTFVVLPDYARFRAEWRRQLDVRASCPRRTRAR